MSEIRDCPTAQIVGFNEHQVIIFCPYCRQAHFHGIAPEHKGAIGRVSSHCREANVNDPERRGYYIPSFDTYDPIKAEELLAEAKANKKAARRQRLFALP